MTTLAVMIATSLGIGIGLVIHDAHRYIDTEHHPKENTDD